MKELIRVRVQYASRQQCCKNHKRPLPLYGQVLKLLNCEIFMKFFVCSLRDITMEEAGVVVTQQDESDLYTGQDTDCPE